MNEFEKMISGRLYNASDAKLGVYHMERMALCQRLNQTLITDQAAIEHLKEELIPSAKGNDLGIFLPFYCEYGTIFMLVANALLITTALFWMTR